MVDFTQLGGTLFIPAIHKSLESIVSHEKYKNLKSVLIDTEDALSVERLEEGLKNIQNLLKTYTKNSLLLFIRPKDIDVLKKLLMYKNIDKIDGFILPKFSLTNANAYLKTLEKTEHFFMPSIEGEELFDNAKLLQLRDTLFPHKEKVILIRFGLEDMLRQLKMRRECNESVFDFAVTSYVLGNFLAVFKAAGFEISGGVYPCFKDHNGFAKDVLRDLKEGLFSKTIVHPSQIDIINELYKVTQKEFDEAKEIVDADGTVFNQNSKMAEVLTMRPYSEFILKRAEVYGIKNKS